MRIAGKLLKDSMDTQDKHLKIAALTALLNSNLTNISILQSERSSLLKKFITNDKDKVLVSKFNELMYFGGQAEWFEYEEEYKEHLKEIEDKKGEFYLLIIKKSGPVMLRTILEC